MNALKSKIDESLQLSDDLFYRIKNLKKDVVRQFLGLDAKSDLTDIYRSGFSSVKWKIIKLNELAVSGGIIQGLPGESDDTLKYSEKGRPVIRQEHIKSLRFFPENFQYIGEEDAADFRQFIVKGGDIIIAIKCEDIGTSALLPFMHEESILGSGLIRIRLNSATCEVFYILNILHFYYHTGIFKELIDLDNELKIISDLPIPLPPVDKQKELADYLLQLSGFMVAQESYSNEMRKLKTIVNVSPF